MLLSQRGIFPSTHTPDCITLILRLIPILLYQSSLFMSPTEAFKLPSPSTDPIQIMTELPESDSIDKLAVNLTKLLIDRGHLLTPADQSNQGTNGGSVRFELLDISMNALTTLVHTSQRVRLVHIHPKTGMLRFKVAVDRERLCPEAQGTTRPCDVNLLLVVYFPVAGDEESANMLYVDLTIRILDVNDNAPYFPQLQSNEGAVRLLTVTEECPIGSLISLPLATDADSMAHGTRRYAFHPSKTPIDVRQHFAIVLHPGTGRPCEKWDIGESNLMTTSTASLEGPITPCLQVIRRIDREQASQFNFRLLAYDAENRSGEVMVRLIVRDVNDHAPVWPAKLSFTVSEGQASTSSVEVVRTVLQGSDSWAIWNATESGAVYYQVRVRECTTRRKLIQLQATDADDSSTLNGQVNYRISDRTPDREQTRRRVFLANDQLYLSDLGLRGLSRSELAVLITASDGTGKESDAWFRFLVEDCNDHRPMILMHNGDFLIPENSPDQVHLVSLITVRDLDPIGSPNSAFRCFLNDTSYLVLNEVATGPSSTDKQHINTMDALNPDTKSQISMKSKSSGSGRWSIYRLETRKQTAFDREQTAYYTVFLQCSDDGQPSLTSQRLITIRVQDVNDNAPQFHLLPNSKRLLKSAADSWPPASQNAASLYHGSDTMATTGVLFEFSVPEDAERGRVVGRVYATDRDSGLNADIDFELIDPRNGTVEKTGGLFSVSSSGEVHLIQGLDREKQDKYWLHIRARDNGGPEKLSSTATVLVRVEDVNDCRPQFHGDYVFQVVESYGSSTVHQILGYLNATDADLGRNGSITYRLATDRDQPRASHSKGSPTTTTKDRSASKLVQLNHDGQITVYGVIDREHHAVLMVDVVAEDNGTPRRLSTVHTVTIHVLDLNDNKPRFVSPPRDDDEEIGDGSGGMKQATESSGSLTKPRWYPSIGQGMHLNPVYALNVSLDTSVGVVLMQFEAIDPDEGQNGTVTFELIHTGTDPTSHRSNSANVGVDEPPTFTLHPDGRLVLTNHLTSEEHTRSDMNSLSAIRPITRFRRPDRLHVRASDQGPQAEHAIAGLHIFYNDPKPLISDLGQEMSLTGGIPMNEDMEKRRHNGPMTSGTWSDVKSKGSRKSISASTTTTYTTLGSLTASRMHGMPVLYLLALTICVVLVLVVVSLIYLYVRMRRPQLNGRGSSHRRKPYDGGTKQEIRTTKPNGTNNNTLRDVRMECNTTATLGRLVSSNDTSVRSNTFDRQSPQFTESTHPGHDDYRTLSTPYTPLEHDGLSSGLYREQGGQDVNLAQRWVTIGPDYTRLNTSGFRCDYPAHYLTTPKPPANNTFCPISAALVKLTPKTPHYGFSMSEEGANLNNTILTPFDSAPRSVCTSRVTDHVPGNHSVFCPLTSGAEDASCVGKLIPSTACSPLEVDAKLFDEQFHKSNNVEPVKTSMPHLTASFV